MKKVPDPRRKKSVEFPFSFLLLCSVLAILSGSKSLLSIYKFGKRHYKEICRALNIEVFKKPPCYNVYRNAFLKNNLNDFENLFGEFFGLQNCKLIHMDGKASAGTIKNSQDSKQSFLMTASAFSSELKQTLNRLSFDSKSTSEVVQVRKLIQKLKGNRLITADSVHCTKETIKLIKENKHNYLIQFKGNQKKLKRQALLIEKERKAETRYKSKEKNRGRLEKRLTKIYPVEADGWADSSSIIIQERWRDRSYEKAFYLSDFACTAERAAKIIRSHWLVETMHRNKDELMGEDRNTTKNHNIAGMLSCLRTIALNIVGKGSFTNFKDENSHDISKLLSFL